MKTLMLQMRYFMAWQRAEIKKYIKREIARGLDKRRAVRNARKLLTD